MRVLKRNQCVGVKQANASVAISLSRPMIEECYSIRFVFSQGSSEDDVTVTMVHEPGILLYRTLKSSNVDRI